MIKGDTLRILDGVHQLDDAVVQLQEAYKVTAALIETHQKAIENLEERITALELR